MKRALLPRQEENLNYMTKAIYSKRVYGKFSNKPSLPSKPPSQIPPPKIYFCNKTSPRIRDDQQQEPEPEFSYFGRSRSRSCDCIKKPDREPEPESYYCSISFTLNFEQNSS